MRENVGELPALVRLAARIGVPEVYVQRMVYYLDHPDPPGLMAAGHALFDDFDARVDRLIAEAEALARDLGVTLRASGATTPRRSLEAGSRPAPPPRAPRPDPRPGPACGRRGRTPCAPATGTCLPCCISPFATSDYASLKLGNLFERPFDEIWNAEPYQTWRAALLSDEPHPACRGCGV